MSSVNDRNLAGFYTSIERRQNITLYKYFKDNCPCSNCHDRRKGCHGNCEKESVYLAGRELLKQKLEKEKHTAKAIAKVRSNNMRKEKAI